MLPARSTNINPPEEMALRALCLSGFVVGWAVPALFVVGWYSGEGKYLLGSLACMSFSVAVLTWLKRTHHLAQVSDAFESSIHSTPRDRDPDGTEDLRRRLEALERHRGDAGFDPWKALDLRRRLEHRIEEAEAEEQEEAETRSE